MVLAVVLGPLVWRVPINDIDFARQAGGAVVERTASAPTISARTCWRACSMAAAMSLAVGLCAMLVAAIVGVLVGAVAGMSRGASMPP